MYVNEMHTHIRSQRCYERAVVAIVVGQWSTIHVCTLTSSHRGHFRACYSH